MADGVDGSEAGIPPPRPAFRGMIFTDFRLVCPAFAGQHIWEARRGWKRRLCPPTKDQLSTFAETPAEPQPAVRGASAVRLLKAACVDTPDRIWCGRSSP